MQQEPRNLAALVAPPRLAGGTGRAPACRNLLGLFLTALVGAGLVHLLAYHVPFDAPLGPRWFAAAGTLLAHCPLRGPLGLIAVIVVLAPIFALQEVWRLERLNEALGRMLTARRLPIPDGRVTVPRSPWRLLVISATVLGPQAALLGAAGLICPMRTTMVMNGAPMVMPLGAALPLGVLQLAVAALLGLLLWRVERRLTRLRATAAQRLRLLLRAASGAAPRLPNLDAARLPRRRYGHSLFARPPPLPVAA
jgi:hypothetical protein